MSSQVSRPRCLIFMQNYRCIDFVCGWVLVARVRRIELCGVDYGRKCLGLIHLPKLSKLLPVAIVLVDHLLGADACVNILLAYAFLLGQAQLLDLRHILNIGDDMLLSFALKRVIQEHLSALISQACWCLHLLQRPVIFAFVDCVRRLVGKSHLWGRLEVALDSFHSDGLFQVALRLLLCLILQHVWPSSQHLLELTILKRHTVISVVLSWAGVGEAFIFSGLLFYHFTDFAQSCLIDLVPFFLHDLNILLGKVDSSIFSNLENLLRLLDLYVQVFLNGLICNISWVIENDWWRCHGGSTASLRPFLQIKVFSVLLIESLLAVHDDWRLTF